MPEVRERIAVVSLCFCHDIAYCRAGAVVCYDHFEICEQLARARSKNEPEVVWLVVDGDDEGKFRGCQESAFG